MEIVFLNKKEGKCYGGGMISLAKSYGEARARKIAQRISELVAADNLAQISKLPPPRCHQLTNNRKNQFSVDLTGNDRMLFVPYYEKGDMPLLEDGGVDLERVKRIAIVELCTNATHK